jgi:AcrR family transcriptional regulator
MSRVVKRPEVRKAEILETARHFFFHKGYDETSIQDIIDKLDIAKGTFYHYFASKAELLDELTERMTSEVSASLKQLLDSPMNAIDKFNAVIRSATAVKLANIDVLLVLLRVIFREENAIIRDKMYRRIVEKNTELFSAIIRQGVEEGLFTTSDPEDAGEVILELGRALNEKVSRLLLIEDKTVEELIRVIKKKTEMYEQMIERILGAAEGSIKVYLARDFEDMVRLIKKNLREHP